MAAPGSLDISQLSYSYGGISALRQVGFAVAPGQICAILGPNGAGKTTLGACIAGVLRTEPGTVLLDGTDISKHGVCERAKRGVVYIPEGGSIFPSLTVAENLAVGRRTGMSDRQVLEKAATYFPFIGDRRKQRAGLLSGGEQRMLALARILITEPRLTIIDELSHGLAPVIVDRIYEALNAARGITTFLLIEQFLNRVYNVADGLLVLSTGDPLYAGPAADITLARVEEMYSLRVSVDGLEVDASGP